ncbi:MAG: hypothetical protein FJ272_05910 [Planctomycetes bacterium]|nr:hypothetical protein [Planctomycetota bacterium]MBM4084306.1 hypothetical protein [Planctomycetota bacterium]
MDYALIFTLLFLFLSTVVGVLLRARAVDKCLKDLDGTHLVVETRAGKKIWGRAAVTSTGLEVAFVSPHGMRSRKKRSYIIYKNEFPAVRIFLRYLDKLSDEAKAQRDRDLRFTYHPNWFQRRWRGVCNIMNAIRDAVIEGFTIMVGQVRKTRVAAPLAAVQDKYLTKAQTEVFSFVSHAYDPLLERHIGTKIIFQFGPQEYVGILKEYTADFLSLLDVPYPGDFELDLKADGTPAAMNGVQASVSGDVVTIQNDGEWEAKLERAHRGQSFERVDKIIGPGARLEHKTTLGPGEVSLDLEIQRLADVVVPRTDCVVRHAAE